MKNIMFMGTPEIAATCLSRLIEDGHGISAVVTREDKPRGRGNVMTPTPVKALALEHGIPVYTPKTLRDVEFAAILDEYKPFEMAALNERKWSMVDNGGTNWFWGVDNNASVKDQYGNTYTLKELKKELEKTMSSKQAKDYILNLQKQLGI